MSFDKIKIFLQYLFFFVPVTAFFFAGRKIWAISLSVLYLCWLIVFEIYFLDLVFVILSSFSGLVYILLLSGLITAVFIGFFWINRQRIETQLEKNQNLKPILFLTLTLFLAQNFILIKNITAIPQYFYLLRINNESMTPLIQKGDVAIAQKINSLHRVQLNDVVVFRLPYSKTQAIGKIIALPGQRVAIKTKKILVNQREITIIPAGLVSNKMTELEEQILPDSCFFIVAENIAQSVFDSLNLGCIDRGQITAKLNYIIFSVTSRQWGRQLTKPAKFSH